MIKFDFDNKQYSFPTKWKDVTFEQFLKLRDWSGDNVLLISILSGIDVETLLRSKAVDIDELLMPLTLFIETEMPVGERKLNGFEPPISIRECTFGQKIAAVTACEKHEDLNFALTEIVAIYMQPIVQGREYGPVKAKEFEAVVLAAPCLDVLNLGGFFLLQLQRLKSRQKSYSVAGMIKNWCKQVLQKWTCSKK